MLIKRLLIENFRGIKKLDLALDRTTVLIGENNSGKTSVLEALQTCLTRALSRRAVPFYDYDFHLTEAKPEPNDADPIVLTVTFEETKKDEWVDEIVQAFPNVIQTVGDDRQAVTFRVTAQYDHALKDVLVEWRFLDRQGDALPTRNPKLVSDLQQLAPFFFLTAIRDASQHFQSRSSFWGPFTRNPQISDQMKEEIEEQIEEINQSVLDAHKPFETVKERLSEAGKLLPLAGKDVVSIEALPARILDLLSRTQVKLASRTGVRLPVAHHGAGTQSLSVLFLFDAFLRSRLAEAYEEHSEPILALEEPESHLHPSAIRALWPMLEKLPGQQIVATHSGDLLAAVPLSSIRRFARRDGEVRAFQVGPATLSPTESEKVSYHIRAKRGALLFARSWLLVEGESEFALMAELAALLGHDFVQAGVCCVEYAQCPMAPLIKVADDLGIEWHVMADGDRMGKAYVKAANALRGPTPAGDRITALADESIEHCLWNGGYQAVYESAVDSVHKGFVTAAKGTPAYRSEVIKAACQSTSKPHLAHAVVAEARKTGSPGVPAALATAINAALELARKSA